MEIHSQLEFYYNEGERKRRKEGAVRVMAGMKNIRKRIKRKRQVRGRQGIYGDTYNFAGMSDLVRSVTAAGAPSQSLEIPIVLLVLFFAQVRLQKCLTCARDKMKYSELQPTKFDSTTVITRGRATRTKAPRKRAWLPFAEGVIFSLSLSRYFPLDPCPLSLEPLEKSKTHLGPSARV